MQRRVLELRLGLTDHEHTTEETADAIGLTVDQTRWVEMQARRALRKLAADTTTTNDDDRLVRLIDPERFTDVSDLARAVGDTNTLGVEMRLYALAKPGVLERRHRADMIDYRTCTQTPRCRRELHRPDRHPTTG